MFSLVLFFFLFSLGTTRKVIRGLATGRFTADAACAMRVIGGQAVVGLLLGTALAIGGFARVWVTEGTTLRYLFGTALSRNGRAVWIFT